MDRLHIVGVRHHSPVCAALVQRTLARVRPRWVLIEGPADFNGRLGELALDHEPPVALFSFHFTDEQRHASWAPFCVHSPEWVALRQGLETGAEVRFIDLPAWAHELRGVENRYADGPVGVDTGALLAHALGEQGLDALWDAAFELPDPLGLEARLDVYFEGLRQHLPASASDLGREDFMGAWVRWALGQGGEVVVVCGGYHAPRLRALAEGLPPPAPPEAPALPEGTRGASWLIPFDQRRLDSFTGYASGLPSPAWYRWVWEEGADQAPRRALGAAVQRLRGRGQPVSVADTVAAWAQACALSRLRGHRTIGRVDLLDAVASTWVKEALDEPLPWAERRALAPSTHPVVVELVRALSGERRGCLDPATPAPPLVHHAREVRERLDLVAPPSRDVSLHVGVDADRERLVALERLVLLGIAGVTRTSEPDAATQVFALSTDPWSETTLLEAAAYGPTLESAATAVLEEQIATTAGFVALVGLLVAAVRAGLPSLSARALDDLTAATLVEHDLGALGLGLTRLVGMLRHGDLGLGDRVTAVAVVHAAVDRLLWLIEGVEGSGPVDLARVRAVAALREASLQVELTVPTDRICAVLERVAVRPTAPVDLRGACLGALASLDVQDVETVVARVLAILDSLPPLRLGDYLAGLIGLARDVFISSEGLLSGVDQAVQALDGAAFTAALPSLRIAFHELPPRERAGIGRAIARLRGATGAAVTGRLTEDPQVVARGLALEAAADVWLGRLFPERGPDA